MKFCVNTDISLLYKLSSLVESHIRHNTVVRVNYYLFIIIFGVSNSVNKIKRKKIKKKIEEIESEEIRRAVEWRNIWFEFKWNW